MEKAALPVHKELAAVLRCLASLALEDEKRVGLAQPAPRELRGEGSEELVRTALQGPEAE